jgi:hypothetical protein
VEPISRTQQILIGTASGLVVFLVLTTGMLVARAMIGSSEPEIASVPPPSPTTPGPETPGPETPAAPAPTTLSPKGPESTTPEATGPEGSTPETPAVKPDGPALPASLEAATPARPLSEPSSGERIIPQSKFLDTEIMPLDTSILNPTEADFRAQAEAEREARVSPLKSEIYELEAKIEKYTTTGNKAAIRECEAQIAELQAKVNAIMAEPLKIRKVPVGYKEGDSFSSAETSGRPHVHSPSTPSGPPSRPSPPGRSRAPMPPADEREAATRELEEIYNFSKAKSDEEELRMAGELLEIAGKSQGAEKFVILQKAAELAAKGGDAPMMMRALGMLGHIYEMDELAVKGRMLKTFATGANTPKKAGQTLEVAMRYARDAIAADKVDYAATAAALAYGAASRSGSTEIRKKALEFKRRIEKLNVDNQKLEDAKLILESDPSNPDANYTLGELYCFARNDWGRGLPYLAKGADPDLAAAATMEMQGGETPEDRVKLGDLWWGVASGQSGDQKTTVMKHAARIYGKALPSLSGLEKAKVKRRIEEAEKLGAPKPLSRPPSRPSTRPPSGAGSRRPSPHSSSRAKIPPDAVSFGGHKYRLVKEVKLTWIQAKAGCEMVGGMLACAETKAEAEFLRRLAGSTDAWSGAMNTPSGNWMWISGMDIGPKPPWTANYAPKAEARAVVGPHGWNDRSMHDRNYFICEWK